MRNKRTDDRRSGTRSQPLVCGKVQNLRGIDRYRATQARPGVTETITHDSSAGQKIRVQSGRMSVADGFDLLLFHRPGILR